MLKQRSQLFEFVFMAVDLVVISLAWCLAYWLRFESDLISVTKGVPPFNSYLSMLLFIWLIWAFVFRRVGLYRPMRGVRSLREIWMLINANLMATVVFISATYLFREKSVEFSRLVFAYFWVFATVGTIFERSVLRSILREIRRRGYNLRYMLIVGAGKLASDIAARVRRHRELGIQVLGCLSKDGDKKKAPLGVSVVGRYDELPAILEKMQIDQLVIALPIEDNNLLRKIMNGVGDSLVDLKVVPDLFEFSSVGSAIEEFDGLPVITVRASPLEGVNRVLKRGLDLVLSFIIATVAVPLMILISILIKLTSRGPIFYAQERVSLDGTRFKIFKFRTMRVDAEVSGPGWTVPGDGRVTWVGQILRKTSLDELPQLFNVIRGDMSIVGPRPERPVFIEQFRSRIPKYMLRHKVPAGMTGWAQVHGWRGDTSIEKRIEHDLYYIENWSLLLDLKILFLTFIKGFGSRNAY